MSEDQRARARSRRKRGRGRGPKRGDQPTTGAPPAETAAAADAPEPLFVDRTMIEALRPRLAAVVEALTAPAGTAERLEVPLLEAPAAAALPGPEAHAAAAEALLPALRPHLPRK
ncbi:MAG: DUF6473 family protein [Nitriliruptoraceae bacterium]